MAKYNISLLLLSLTIFLTVSGVTSCRRCSKTRAFINYSCSITRYPKVCEQTLSGYVHSTNITHEELAQITLRASLARARFARAYLTKLASNLKNSTHSRAIEYSAIGSCIDQINDSVAQLRQSLFELRKYSTEERVDDFMWHMSNVVTWASSALTDQTECTEAFSGNGIGKNLRNVIKAKVNDVSRVTSNALALVNRFVTRRQFAHKSIQRP